MYAGEPMYPHYAGLVDYWIVFSTLIQFIHELQYSSQIIETETILL